MSHVTSVYFIGDIWSRILIITVTIFITSLNKKTHKLSSTVLLKFIKLKKFKKLTWLTLTTRVWQFDSSYFRGFFHGRFHDYGVPNGRIAILFVYTLSRGKINRNLFNFASLWRIFNSKKVNFTKLAFRSYYQCIILSIFGVDLP